LKVNLSMSINQTNIAGAGLAACRQTAYSGGCMRLS
jgi:hypothetical protein